MTRVDSFHPTALRAICDVLGDTSVGLTGSEIAQCLHDTGIEAVGGKNKRGALFNALLARQQKDGCGNNVVAFIQVAMYPIRYVGNHVLFEDRRGELNRALTFCGYHLAEDGKLRRGVASRTLTEAEARAGRLRKALTQRSVHPEVLAHCKAELVQDDCFHAVFEACKSVAAKIRRVSGLTSDGAQLVDEAFGRSGGPPVVAFNSLRSETEISEHSGLMNLMKGLFGVFRNTTAHAPRIHWRIDEADALDVLSIASLLHRRLDSAVRVPTHAPGT